MPTAGVADATASEANPDPKERGESSKGVTPSLVLGNSLKRKRQGKHTIDRFNRSGFAAFTTIDGMTTVPASSRIGLGGKKKKSEGAR